MKKLIYMYRYAKNKWIFSILCPIVMTMEAWLELRLPKVIKELVNYLTKCSELSIDIDRSILLGYGGKMLLFSLGSLTCGILGGIFASIASSSFAKALKDDLFKSVESFSFANIDKYTTSSLITRMTTDSNWVQMSFQMTIRMLFRSPVIFTISVIQAYKCAPSLAPIFFIAIPIIVVGLLAIFLSAHPIMERGIKKIDILNEVVEENIRGIRVVKSFVREEDEINKFGKTNEEIYRTFNKAHKIINLNGPLMTGSIYIVMIIVAITGSKLIASPNNLGFDNGDLTEIFTYSSQILSSLMMLSMIFAMFVISKPSRDRIYEVLKEVPTIKNPDNPIYDVENGSITFDKVYFKYNETSEKYALSNINLDIKSGETIGILGTTGSSKTSLISLIARLYDVTQGEVRIAGRNVKEYDLKSLRDAVAVVLQKNVLFSGTIKENLRWGNNEATDEEIIEAAKIAQADEFINDMPNKYDTYIEQGGSNVSGGQKQRLCIARAILKNPKVLILDDSMSAVDTKTDKSIREKLKVYRPDITKIIVAQRCQSVMDADKIIIIDNGEIIDIGNHNELLKTSKAYQEVYYSQNKEVNE